MAVKESSLIEPSVPTGGARRHHEVCHRDTCALEARLHRPISDVATSAAWQATALQRSIAFHAKSLVAAADRNPLPETVPHMARRASLSLTRWHVLQHMGALLRSWFNLPLPQARIAVLMLPACRVYHESCCRSWAHSDDNDRCCC